MKQREPNPPEAVRRCRRRVPSSLYAFELPGRLYGDRAWNGKSTDLMTESESSPWTLKPRTVLLTIIVAVKTHPSSDGITGSQKGMGSNRCRPENGAGPLEFVFQWKVLKYRLPKGFPKTLFHPENAFITGIEVTSNRIFITVARVLNGTIATLGTVPKNSSEPSPVIEPYPSWDWHAQAASGNVKDCNVSIVSVYRITKDKCNRLWIVDSGILDLLDNPRLVCPPKILVFDLNTDKLVRMMPLPKDVIMPESLIQYLVIDYDRAFDRRCCNGSPCDNVYVYIFDTVNGAVIVLDSVNGKFWRISNRYMYPDPRKVNHTVGGETYYSDYAIVSGLLIRDRLYYQAYASDSVYSSNTMHLKQGVSMKDHFMLPARETFVKPCASIAQALDGISGNIIFSTICNGFLLSCNPVDKSKRRLVAESAELLQVVTDIKDDVADPRVKWLVSSRLQKYFLRTVNRNEVNQRILRINIYCNN